mmetsp:Transcript_34858/g.77483  ORF Transcript_34858/g.77483 Transcript_34858/m.77483 type:complete len:83 (+) Transcript_34858:397-645(+)
MSDPFHSPSICFPGTRTCPIISAPEHELFSEHATTPGAAQYHPFASGLVLLSTLFTGPLLAAPLRPQPPHARCAGPGRPSGQ